VPAAAPAEELDDAVVSRGDEVARPDEDAGASVVEAPGRLPVAVWFAR
jgi:hypothetical protein